MRKVLLFGLPLTMIAPLLLLMLGAGSANIESVQTACTTMVSSSTGSSMGIGTVNWRGATQDERDPRPGQSDSERVSNVVTAIGDSGASIIGFQEFEPRLARAFRDAASGEWQIVKGRGADGNPSAANAIAYQPSAWTLEETRYVTIRIGGPMVEVPLARFTSTADRGSVWVLNTHHPGDVVGGTQEARDAAVRSEAAALTKLQEADPDAALFLTGDMSDDDEFQQLFMSITAGWSTANNPTDTRGDWIMGGPDVAFAGTAVDQGTEHTFMHTTAQLAADAPRSAGGGTDLGAMPAGIPATAGKPVTGEVLVANANIKTRAGFNPGVAALAGPEPDFITLNEVGDVPLAQMRSAAPGYSAYREDVIDRSPGGGEQSVNNAIMWRTDTWTRLAGGRVKIVDDDHVVTRVGNRLWDRYAAWGIFQRADGAVVSVIAVHHMTNAYRYPAQWGNPPMSRADQYGLGMDHLVRLVDVLGAHGPVLVGGDMNSHPSDGPHAAAPRMASAGYQYTKDAGVIYSFYTAPAAVMATWQISQAAVHSDHPALFTRLAMNGAGPGSSSTPAGCVPCPTAISVQDVAADDELEAAEVAAEAALEAGFRGEDLVTAVAIARVESSWNVEAVNGTHYGLWQISAQHKGRVPGWFAPSDIFDPLVNARYAFALYSARSGSGEAKFSDWIPFQKTDYRQYLEVAREAVAAVGGGSTSAGCVTETGGVSGDRLDRLRQRAEMVIELSKQYSSPCSVPGFDCQGVGFSGWSNACTAISMMIYGNAHVGPGDGGERAFGSVVQGQQGSSWPPPPGAIVSWPYSGSGHVAIYLGNGDWVDNWGPVGHNAHNQVEKGAAAHWLLPPPSFEGTFLNDGIGTTSI